MSPTANLLFESPTAAYILKEGFSCLGQREKTSTFCDSVVCETHWASPSVKVSCYLITTCTFGNELKILSEMTALSAVCRVSHEARVAGNRYTLMLKSKTAQHLMLVTKETKMFS